MLATSLLVTGVLNFHHVIAPQLNLGQARWQAHQRARLAAWLIESELHKAGDWGLVALDEVAGLPAAVSGGRGQVRCANFPCISRKGDALAFSGHGEDALIIRHVMPTHAAEASVIADNQGPEPARKLSPGAIGLYLAGQPRGLYVRNAQQRDAQELVRGIVELKCDYAVSALEGPVTRLEWRSSKTVINWHQVEAVRCKITAVSDELPLLSTGHALSSKHEVHPSAIKASRVLMVVLDNPREQHRALAGFKAMMTAGRE